MASQYMKNEKYYDTADILLDIECDLKIAATNKNDQIATFAKKMLRKIAESREKDNGITTEQSRKNR